MESRTPDYRPSVLDARLKFMRRSSHKQWGMEEGFGWHVA